MAEEPAKGQVDRRRVFLGPCPCLVTGLSYVCEGFCGVCLVWIYTTGTRRFFWEETLRGLMI